GGLELFCDSQKIHRVNVDLPHGEDDLTMKHLLSWVRSNLIKERYCCLLIGGRIDSCCRRPGVLVLVNDCDWELSGQLETTIKE
ncbi:unnamed protein product, partial [Brassica rapa]